MDTSIEEEEEEEEEVIPLVSRPGISAPVRDIRQNYQRQLAVYLILASILFERIAYFSIVTNITVTLQSNQTFKWSPQHSSTVSNIFSGTSQISTLIFAVISDAKLGRARMIIVGFSMYLMGYILIIITAYGNTWFCQFHEHSNLQPSTVIGDENCAPAILGTLIFTAIGAGAVRSNIIVLGAEQTQDFKMNARYFDKYVIAVNIGNIINVCIISYIQSGNQFNDFIGYIIAASMLFVAALLFIIGLRYYIHVKPHDTVIIYCIPVIINAFQSWYRYKKSIRSIEETQTISLSNSRNISHSYGERVSIEIDERPSTFLDFAKIVNFGKFSHRIVDDVKSLRSAIIVFTLLIPYWLIYNQISTSFPLQGQQMYGSKQQNIVLFMSLSDSVVIIIGIIILDVFVYKYFTAGKQSLSVHTRLIIGMCLGAITMCIAGEIEDIRQNKCHGNKDQSDLSIYNQLPQYICLGLSEVFLMVASYEFSYFAAPRSAQSLFMSLRFASFGVSSFINAAYISAFSIPPFKLDFSCNSDWPWNFYTYFYILAGVQLVFIIIFIICQKIFHIIKFNPQQTGTTLFFRHVSSS